MGDPEVWTRGVAGAYLMMMLNRAIFPIAIAGACSGCAGSASMVLRTPVSQQCASAGLQGCDDLAEGVLLQAEGRQDEAFRKLKSGAAENSPEQVKQFIMLLQALEHAPGVGKYSAAINQAIVTLQLDTSAPGRPDAPSNSAGVVAESAPHAGPQMHGKARGVVTADTDIGQIRDGFAKPPSMSPEWCSGIFGKGTRCSVVSRGPLFLTDAAPSAVDCQGQFLAVMEGIQVKAKFEAPVRLHGARIVIPEKYSLVIGQRDAPPADAEQTRDEHTVVLDEVSEEWSCGLYWSGFVPYEMNPYRGEQPTTEWDF